jgi:hypothetical protein
MTHRVRGARWSSSARCSQTGRRSRCGPQSAYMKIRKGYLAPHKLGEFAFVACSSVLIVLEPNTLILRVARARTGLGRSTFT